METARQMVSRAHRYPVAVPVLIDGASGTTLNISVTGVLFEVPATCVLPSEASVRFSLLFGGLGTGPRLRMDCSGKTVRIADRDDSSRLVAVTIETSRVAYFGSSVDH